VRSAARLIAALLVSFASSAQALPIPEPVRTELLELALGVPLDQQRVAVEIWATDDSHPRYVLAVARPATRPESSELLRTELILRAYRRAAFQTFADRLIDVQDPDAEALLHGMALLGGPIDWKSDVAHATGGPYELEAPGRVAYVLAFDPRAISATLKHQGEDWTAERLDEAYRRGLADLARRDVRAGHAARAAHRMTELLERGWLEPDDALVAAETLGPVDRERAVRAFAMRPPLSARDSWADLRLRRELLRRFTPREGEPQTLERLFADRDRLGASADPRVSLLLPRPLRHMPQGVYLASVDGRPHLLSIARSDEVEGSEPLASGAIRPRAIEALEDALFSKRPVQVELTPDGPVSPSVRARSALADAGRAIDELQAASRFHGLPAMTAAGDAGVLLAIDLDAAGAGEIPEPAQPYSLPAITDPDVRRSVIWPASLRAAIDRWPVELLASSDLIDDLFGSEAAGASVRGLGSDGLPIVHSATLFDQIDQAVCAHAEFEYLVAAAHPSLGPDLEQALRGAFRTRIERAFAGSQHQPGSARFVIKPRWRITSRYTTNDEREGRTPRTLSTGQVGLSTSMFGTIWFEAAEGALARGQAEADRSATEAATELALSAGGIEPLRRVLLDAAPCSSTTILVDPSLVGSDVVRVLAAAAAEREEGPASRLESAIVIPHHGPSEGLARLVIELARVFNQAVHLDPVGESTLRLEPDR